MSLESMSLAHVATKEDDFTELVRIMFFLPTVMLLMIAKLVIISL